MTPLQTLLPACLFDKRLAWAMHAVGVSSPGRRRRAPAPPAGRVRCGMTPHSCVNECATAEVVVRMARRSIRLSLCGSHGSGWLSCE